MNKLNVIITIIIVILTSIVLYVLNGLGILNDTQNKNTLISLIILNSPCYVFIFNLFGAIQHNPIEEEMVQNPFNDHHEHGSGSFISILAIIGCVAIVVAEYKLIQYIIN